MPEPELARKLNLKPGMRARVLGKPADVDLGDVQVAEGGAEAVIAFVRSMEDVGATCGSVVEAAKQDRLAWIAYPKAGQLGTDLSRDVLAQRVQEEGVRAVRQVSVDSVWSALRFRPAK